MMAGMAIIYRIDSKREDLREDDPEFAIDVSAGRTLVQMSRSEAFKSWVFYCMMVGGFLLAFLAQAGNSNIVAYLSDVGYSVAFQGFIVSMSMLVLAIAKIVLGKVLDRFDSSIGIALFSLSMILFCVALIFIRWPVAPYLYVIGYAVSASGGTVATSYLVPLFFGQKDFARIYVLINVALNLGTALGASYPGMIYDRCGSYMPAWYLLLAFAILMTISYGLAYWDHTCRVKKLSLQ